jgi:hypothetical protein
VSGSKPGALKCGSTELEHGVRKPAKRKHHKDKTALLASGTHTFTGAGQSLIVLRFTSSAKKLLATGKAQHATIVVGYVTSGQAPTIATKQIKLTAPKRHGKRARHH